MKYKFNKGFAVLLLTLSIISTFISLILPPLNNKEIPVGLAISGIIFSSALIFFIVFKKRD